MLFFYTEEFFKLYEKTQITFYECQLTLEIVNYGKIENLQVHLSSLDSLIKIIKSLFLTRNF